MAFLQEDFRGEHMPGTHYRTERAHGGFTLIELLAVMLIMALLLTVSLPAFRNLARGRGIDRAAREVASAVHMARQRCALEQKHTFLVFADKDVAEAAGRPDLAYRAYALFAGSEDRNTADERLTSWRFLPDHTVFDPLHTPNDSNHGNIMNLYRNLEINTEDLMISKMGMPSLTYGSKANIQTLRDHPSYGKIRIYIAEGTPEEIERGSLREGLRAIIEVDDYDTSIATVHTEDYDQY
ncbi:pilus assembly FimT family protein [Kiritimatiella glycovorans]|nr:type II secretion system protein [Kiritimatiella glycovorans]